MSRQPEWALALLAMTPAPRATTSRTSRTSWTQGLIAIWIIALTRVAMLVFRARVRAGMVVWEARMQDRMRVMWGISLIRGLIQMRIIVRIQGAMLVGGGTEKVVGLR
jgi:hypothetical protein